MLFLNISKGTCFSRSLCCTCLSQRHKQHMIFSLLCLKKADARTCLSCLHVSLVPSRVSCACTCLLWFSCLMLFVPLAFRAWTKSMCLLCLTKMHVTHMTHVLHVTHVMQVHVLFDKLYIPQSFSSIHVVHGGRRSDKSLPQPINDDYINYYLQCTEWK